MLSLQDLIIKIATKSQFLILHKDLLSDMTKQLEPTNSSPAGIIAKIRLPHPYLTTWFVSKDLSTPKFCRLVPEESERNRQTELALHDHNLLFTQPELQESSARPPLSDNTPWARCRRSPKSIIRWTEKSEPSPNQIWLIIYAIFTTQSDFEIFRLSLCGESAPILAASIIRSGLADAHPIPINVSANEQVDNLEIVVSRSAFWQGAGSPYGSKSIWTCPTDERKATEVLEYNTTTRFPDYRIHQTHPRRPAKPLPGALLYSRYIPTLDEHFSIIAVDYTNDEHLQRFHKWQNDPRVAKGWNETGTLEQHREYLRKQHDDPHSLTVFGRFNDTCFSYFELYWAKEDTLGAYYDAGDFDRGRHSLVGDSKYRGKHRVSAWWPSMIHFLFLDDNRTQNVVGEPKADNKTVLSYDLAFGLHVEKFVDFPHKRAALVRVSRERFFSICPFDKSGVVAGTGISLSPKL